MNDGEARVDAVEEDKSAYQSPFQDHTHHQKKALLNGRKTVAAAAAAASQQVMTPNATTTKATMAKQVRRAAKNNQKFRVASSENAEKLPDTRRDNLETKSTDVTNSESDIDNQVFVLGKTH